MDPLTPMQRSFVVNMLKGMRQTDAAREAGYRQPAEAASRMMRRDYIIRELEKGQAEAKDRADYDIDDKRRALWDVYNDAMENKQFGAANQAVAELNKMDGDLAAQRQEIVTAPEFDYQLGKDRTKDDTTNVKDTSQDSLSAPPARAAPASAPRPGTDEGGGRGGDAPVRGRTTH